MAPMNNRLLVPQKLPLLLDYAPGAAAAYSLRALSNSYTGPVVTVRRSTDSAERDFTATEVSDNTLVQKPVAVYQATVYEEAEWAGLGIVGLPAPAAAPQVPVAQVPPLLPVGWN